MLVRFLQSSKESIFILCMLAGISISVRFSHSSKAELSMPMTGKLFIDFGIIIILTCELLRLSLIPVIVIVLLVLSTIKSFSAEHISKRVGRTSHK